MHNIFTFLNLGSFSLQIITANYHGHKKIDIF